MLNCNTLIINNGNNTDLPGLRIGGLKLEVRENGNLSTVDADGNEQVIGGLNNGRFKHIQININNTTQTILSYKEIQIYFDENYNIINNEDFSNGTNENSVKLSKDGFYFISYSITLDMYRGNKTTVGAYMKNIILDKIIDKSISYTYYQQSSRGFGTINNSFIYQGNINDEISLYVKVKEGNGRFYTVPLLTNFNILKIE